MAMLRINATGPKPVPHKPGPGLNQAIRAAMPGRGPIIVMVHGYRFAPGHPLHCPHPHIFSRDPNPACPRATSWPRRLGFGLGNPEEGLCVAFGWDARGSLLQASRSAETAAQALAALVVSLRAQSGGRPVHIVAHSMGGHLALGALGDLRAGDIGRVILLNAASYRRHAARALISPAGRTAEVIDVWSGENTAYDLAFSWMIWPRMGNDRTLRGRLHGHNTLNLRLDCAAARGALDELGYPLGAPGLWPCHWSTYMRPGVFALYQALLRAPERLPLPMLRGALERGATRRPAQSPRRRLSRSLRPFRISGTAQPGS